MVITHILETHRNEDYVTGSAELQALTGARILHGDLDFGYGATITDGREIELGSIVLRAISTPGHTPESMCYGIVDREGGLETVGAFTGDTLLVGGVGRTDLLGPENIEEMSAMQYDSIFGRLLPLGDGVVIFPAHGAGSVCGSNIASREDSTIGLEKAQNPWLQVGGKEEFIALKRNEMLERPYYFDRMEEVNLKGQPLLGRLPVAPPRPCGGCVEIIWRSGDRGRALPDILCRLTHTWFDKPPPGNTSPLWWLDRSVRPTGPAGDGRTGTIGPLHPCAR